MSLQVWLPLTKDLRQQGLSDLTFSLISANTAIDNSGKLGKCYLNNSLGAGGLLSNKTIELGQKQSMFCWFKFIDLTSSSSLGGGLVSQHRYPTNQGMGITIKYVSSTTGYLSVDTGTGSSRTYNTYCGTTLLQANTWYHGGYTYDNGTLKIYVNGNCEYTGSIGTMSVPADYITVFCWSMGSSTGNGVYSGYKFHGYLNDVRIYDHCLSSMEVKQLAQGLVLHYPLADAYVEETTNLVTGLTAGGQTIIDGNTVKTKGESNADTYFYIKTSALTSGTTYTLSCYVSGLENGKFWSFGIGAQSGANKCCSFVLYNGYNSCTFTLPSGLANATQLIWDDDNYSVARATTIMQVSNIQLEQKDHATGYAGVNGTRTSTIVYDNSGFCNNGIIYKYDNNGDIIIDSNTPKYSVCTHIQAGSPTVSNATGLCYIYSNFALTTPNQLTISFWCKPIHNYQDSTSRQGVFCTTNGSIGIDAGTDYNTTAMHHRDSSIDMCQNDGTWNNFGTPFVVGEWHHYTFLYNGKNMQWYKDGIFQSEKAFSNAGDLKSFTAIVIGFTKAGGVYRKNDCYMSDFRIYATALSADDVKSLYQNCATIGSDGTIYGQIRS